MGYPYGKTYLEQIQEDKDECMRIQRAYYLLLKKHCKDNRRDDIELTLKQMLALLAEAFELESTTLDGITDEYHFMWDIVDALLTPKKEEDGKH